MLIPNAEPIGASQMTIDANKSKNTHCMLTRCEHCAISEACMAHAIDTSIPPHSPLNRHYMPTNGTGSHIYWAGDTFQHIYAVKSGCVKSYTVDEEGNERVRGFYLPGDLLGLDAIYTGAYPSNACAVAPSQICGLPYSQFTKAIASLPEMQTRMLNLMSKDLFTALALCGDFTAEQRLAAFMLHLLERERSQSISTDNRIALLMSRRDIASFLRLVPETVSRVLGRFQKSGWINSKPKSVDILDHQALALLAEPVGISIDTMALSKAA